LRLGAVGASARAVFFFFFQAEDGIRDFHVTGVQTCALPISARPSSAGRSARPRPRPRPAASPATSRSRATPPPSRLDAPGDAPHFGLAGARAMDDTSLEATAHSGLGAIAPAEWDACACPEAAAGGRPLDPFTTHRFLSALERSGSVGKGAGWQPHHLVVRALGSPVAVMPLYAKSHSQGEYIFDWNWADAFERAGGRYYPKLQSAVPFTPVTGRRFLAKPGWEGPGRAALLHALVQIAADNRLSSAHVTFCTAEEAEAGAAQGLLRRKSQQFHWLNAGYADFDAFLAALASRKRKAIRKERATAAAFGGTIRKLTGAEIEPRHWDAFWAFYQDTGSRKWGRPYLTRAFFDEIHAT